MTDSTDRPALSLEDARWLLGRLVKHGKSIGIEEAALDHLRALRDVKGEEEFLRAVVFLANVGRQFYDAIESTEARNSRWN